MSSAKQSSPDAVPDSGPDQAPVTAVPGVGPQLAGKLARLGISCVQDLLFHLPARYEDRTRHLAIGAAKPGDRALFIGRVEHAGVAYGRRRSLLIRLSDGTGALTMRLFHFSPAQQRNLVRDRWVRCFGEVRRGPATLELVHPEYRVSDQQPAPPGDEGLTPIYPATQGITQGVLRRIIDRAARSYIPGLPELLPASLLRDLALPDLQTAVATLHHPPIDCDIEALSAGRTAAQRRLGLEELLAHHLSLRRIRARRNALGAPSMTQVSAKVDELVAGLDFALTGAQTRVIREILEDLAGAKPMLRLVQGDVGSGKTVVAAAAVVRAAENGLQTAFMAPTELLAEQHFRTLDHWLTPIGLRMAWLSGGVTARRRRQTMRAIGDGEVDVVVGTHALFQANVAFARLGLVVVDEQHRFGVDQRLALRDKGGKDGLSPHQLIMTATPIPRTLAMTFYADLDVSNIDEMPPGREPVETVVVPETRRDEVVARVRQSCGSGRQAYWVCPLIDESETLSAQAALATHETLNGQAPELRIGLIHGRVKSADKDAVMNRFRHGEIDVLVATTVIEVGVDVPNASLMIIENSERLGVSQLHQLRGRVGRGAQKSACVLLYRTPLSDPARFRLTAMRETSDGFEIARRDLELRGPGEVLGTRQTGLQQLKVADLVRDRALLPTVQALGRRLWDEYPECIPPLIARWVLDGDKYAQV